MIDYKLVLILVLSIVLLFVYNKTEELREEVDKLKKKNKDSESSKEKVKTSEELLNLFQEKNRIVTDEIEEKVEVKQQACPIKLNDEKCDYPVISQTQSLNKTYIVENAENDNTSSYNATESSEEIDINYEDASSSQNNEYVVFSNEKENSEIINVQSALDNLENDEDVLNLEKNQILIASTILTKTYNGNIDIINDSSNSEEKNNIKIEELEEYSQESKANSEEEKIMREFDNIEIINDNGVIQLQKISDSDDEEEEEEEEDQNQSSETLDGDINTSEFQKINLNSITKYKLNDLQTLAKKFNIRITKDKNGKEINKTKKELYSELTLHKQN